MSDSGRQIGLCQHGRTAEWCEDCLLADRDRWMQEHHGVLTEAVEFKEALEAITAERDRLQAELAHCREVLARRSRQYDNAVAIAAEAQRERDRLREELAAAREALRPFAAQAAEWDGMNLSSCVSLVEGRGWFRGVITAGDCRRAAEVLKEAKP